MKSKLFQDPLPSPPSCRWDQTHSGSTEPPYRTDSQPGFGDPGGGDPVGPSTAEVLIPPILENKSVLEMKRSQQLSVPSCTSNNSSNPQGNASLFAAASGGQTHYHVMQPQQPPQLTSPPQPDTDSALEAAVNSILEC